MSIYILVPDIIQLLTFVEVNIRIYRSKIYDICRGRSRGKYHISWNDRSPILIFLPGKMSIYSVFPPEK